METKQVKKETKVGRELWGMRGMERGEAIRRHFLPVVTQMYGNGWGHVS